MIHVLYLVEESTGNECFVALPDGLGRIRELSASRYERRFYLEWEEISLVYPELLKAQRGAMVHLVFLGRLAPEDGIRFVFPGQSLGLATLREEKARKELVHERAVHGEDLVHMWSVPLGWEVPGLHEFLGRGKRNVSNESENRGER